MFINNNLQISSTRKIIQDTIISEFMPKYLFIYAYCIDPIKLSLTLFLQSFFREK